MLVEIKNDPYFISQRVKEIDSNYLIYFNIVKKVFEIHSTAQLGDSYCLTIPYSCLDSRALELIRKTRIENQKKLFEEIDAFNEKLQEQNKQKILDEAKERLKAEIKKSKNV